MYPEFSSAITAVIRSQQSKFLENYSKEVELSARYAHLSQNAGTGFRGQSGETGTISISLLKR